MNTNKTLYQAILKIVVEAKNRDEAYKKLGQELDEMAGLLLDQMEVKMIFEEDEPIATYQLSRGDAKLELEKRGKSLADLTTDQWEDIAHYAQKGLEGFMDGWDIIIANAVELVLGEIPVRKD